MTNVGLALVWVATGALAVGMATAVAARRAGLSKWILPCLLAGTALLVCCSWLALPVTARGLTIGSDQPGQIECGSGWGTLHIGTPYIYTDAGRQYGLGYGECQDAAWHRVAVLGAAEVGLAAILALAAAVVPGRRERSSREVDRTTAI